MSIFRFGAAAAAAAKSLQSCPTLCDPVDGSPPGCPSLGFSRQEHWSGLPFPSPMRESEKWKGSHLVESDPQWSHGLQPSRLLRPWDFPGKSTGVDCHCLLLIIVLNFYKIMANIYWTIICEPSQPPYEVGITNPFTNKKSEFQKVLNYLFKAIKPKQGSFDEDSLYNYKITVTWEELWSGGEVPGIPKETFEGSGTDWR